MWSTDLLPGLATNLQRTAQADKFATLFVALASQRLVLKRRCCSWSCLERAAGCWHLSGVC